MLKLKIWTLNVDETQNLMRGINNFEWNIKGSRPLCSSGDSSGRVFLLHVMSCLGLETNEEEAIREDEKEFQNSRMLGNYFLNARHPDVALNNVAPLQCTWHRYDRDGMHTHTHTHTHTSLSLSLSHTHTHSLSLSLSLSLTHTHTHTLSLSLSLTHTHTHTHTYTHTHTLL